MYRIVLLVKLNCQCVHHNDRGSSLALALLKYFIKFQTDSFHLLLRAESLVNPWDYLPSFYNFPFVRPAALWPLGLKLSDLLLSSVHKKIDQYCTTLFSLLLLPLSTSWKGKTLYPPHGKEKLCHKFWWCNSLLSVFNLTDFLPLPRDNMVFTQENVVPESSAHSSPIFLNLILSEFILGTSLS